jgi:hypothetical protein
MISTQWSPVIDTSFWVPFFEPPLAEDANRPLFVIHHFTELGFIEPVEFRSGKDSPFRMGRQSLKIFSFSVDEPSLILTIR